MPDPINPPRGMRDFLPIEKAKRERLLSVIRSTFRSHGFDEIETPVVEEWSRLNSGVGGDNEKLSYAVLKRALTPDDLHAASSIDDVVDLGLRFDLTVPLVRFYASHRGELPAVFRSIQLGSVWRAERPQKGRYRQFVQCDVDIFGEAGPLAEAELLIAGLATLDALGLDDVSVRINDRRLLLGMLTGFGFSTDELDGVLITIDKLDKVGADGVIAELTQRGATPDAVTALGAFFRRPTTMEFLPFGERAIRKALPQGADDEVIAGLVAIGEAVNSARTPPSASAGGITVERSALRFDPFLVRGMGYYTGPIFEVEHPSVSYSVAGGGRYDGMVGRFLGSEVPAVGFSLGFERLVDLVELPDDQSADSVALVYDDGVSPAALAALKAALLASGARVRLSRRTKNVKSLLDSLTADGFTRFGFVDATTTPESLELRPLG